MFSGAPSLVITTGLVWSTLGVCFRLAGFGP